MAYPARADGAGAGDGGSALGAANERPGATLDDAARRRMLIGIGGTILVLVLILYWQRRDHFNLLSTEKARYAPGVSDQDGVSA